MECRAVVVFLDKRGRQKRKLSSTKQALLDFGMDEAKIPSIIIRYEHMEQVLTMQGHVSLFGPEISAGKATISLKEQGVHVNISKADPTQLRLRLTALMKQLRTSVDRRKLNQDEEQPTSLRLDPRIRRPLGAIQLNQLEPSSPPRKSCKVQSQAGGNLKRPSRALRAVAEGGVVGNPAIDASLTPEQKDVLMAVLSGRNVFFTGSAGTGKSYLIGKIIEALPKATTVVTASTGVAACAIGGTTLHAFAGVQAGSSRLPVNTSAWTTAKVLLIDEVSMIDAPYFDQLEQTARRVRRCNKPFGGLQLVLVGDFLQLPPVTKRGEETQFCFQAKSWDACVHECFHLSQVHRQRDRTFVDILHRCRLGQCTPSDITYIQRSATHRLDSSHIRATRLCTHVKEAKQINEQQLSKLSGSSKLFTRSDASPDVSRSSLASRVEKVLELKVGAQVMLSANVNVSAGLANGSRGVVVKFDAVGWPVVEFANGREETVRMHTWRIRTAAGRVMECKQVPLRLAWAVSIHKSQGMTLDALEVDLSRVFEWGQAYVALSRARTYEGLCVKRFSAKSIRAHPRVLAFYRSKFNLC
ncbi:hypothetical protein PTSG_07735 [Salpingoeca rosetta]|uniref:ATP-dependent DNA helicase n=1 Tax=Salpingoeca rosetta (strain ATCC 50818 / BSB-021) TaxID=946362 RepID=F2UHM3_SALR5|nr:uncharacterized protein PTSG_07735 [Salpingoeca rosetta]EGD76622.1 hypothetical protein PTSG_07735 [Salpingoeca rosetta]|eukprot:XP_004991536.1 hypothetical protein PTSG_07735 [Salpingoeca rosetta]